MYGDMLLCHALTGPMKPQELLRVGGSGGRSVMDGGSVLRAQHGPQPARRIRNQDGEHVPFGIQKVHEAVSDFCLSRVRSSGDSDANNNGRLIIERVRRLKVVVLVVDEWRSLAVAVRGHGRMVEPVKPPQCRWQGALVPYVCDPPGH